MYAPRQDSNQEPHREIVKRLTADAGSNNTWVVELNAEPGVNTGPKLVVKVVNSAGNDIASVVSLELDLGALLLTNFSNAATPTDKVIKLRETKGCDAYGNDVYALVLRSKWYSTPVGNDFT